MRRARWRRQTRLAAFYQGLALLGWTIGRDVRVAISWTTANPTDIRRHAAELAALTPDVILLGSGHTARREMQRLIDEKDLPPEEVKGGPYEQYFLIVHTGEGALGKDNVGAFLQGATFQARFIEHAYFWLPPLLDVPVVFELKLTQAAPHPVAGGRQAHGPSVRGHER